MRFKMRVNECYRDLTPVIGVEAIIASVRIPSMKALLLYLTAALATGVQVYWLLAWSIWGAPTSRTQYLALCGSLVLFIAALLALWKPRAAAITALCASAVIWCFYAPALVITFIRLPYGTYVLQPRLALRLFPSFLLALTPVALLTVSTYYAIVSLRLRHFARRDRYLG